MEHNMYKLNMLVWMVNTETFRSTMYVGQETYIGTVRRVCFVSN